MSIGVIDEELVPNDRCLLQSGADYKNLLETLTLACSGQCLIVGIFKFRNEYRSIHDTECKKENTRKIISGDVILLI